MSEIQTLHLSYRTESNEMLQTQIGQLYSQMQGLPIGSPESEFDQLQLAREERELEIRKENPNLDPTTQDGEKALAQIMSQDPELQALNSDIQALTYAHPNECTSWGIPIDS